MYSRERLFYGLWLRRFVPGQEQKSEAFLSHFGGNMSAVHVQPRFLQHV